MDEWLSRAVNVLTFGSPREKFCARAYRLRWWWNVGQLDRYFLWRRGERGHCKRVHDESRRR